jgi:hypothetical protein
MNTISSSGIRQAIVEKNDDQLQPALGRLAARRSTRGRGRPAAMLRREGWTVNGMRPRRFDSNRSMRLDQG